MSRTATHCPAVEAARDDATKTPTGTESTATVETVIQKPASGSVIIPVRMSAEERNRLDQMAASEQTGCENRTEFIRMLLAREWNRRKNLGKPTAADYQTAFRNGRPKATTPSSAGATE